ncbi:MAG TPA: hypothetical protein VGS03_14380 [Candidatus Polarisedimenticolia bacterium]|jgi:hypothetical protein|nr:hypothetical protein [Candidatus Polarisedimenticolia bacterium]
MSMRPAATTLLLFALLVPARAASSLASTRPADGKTPQPQVLSFKALSTPSNGQQPIVSGAVGLDSILVVSERRIKRFDKAGNPVGLDQDLDAFFGYPAGSGSIRYPRVQYDRVARLFWLIAATDTYPSEIFIAVASEPLSGFSLTHFTQDQGDLTLHDIGGKVVHSLSLGVDRQALYIGAVLQDPLNLSRALSTGFVLPKSQVFNASGPKVTALRGFTVCDVPPYQTCHGAWAVVGVNNDDPLSQDGFFIGTSYHDSNALLVYRIQDPGSNFPSLWAPRSLAISPLGFPWAVPHLGGDQPLADFAAPALTSATMARDKITGEASIVAALVEGNGVRTSAHWYRITDFLPGPPASVAEEGVLADPSPGSPNSFLNPTVAMSGQGHIAVGATTSAPDEHLNAVTAGRYAGFASNSTTWTAATASANAYTPVQVDPTRHPWTHASSTVVDPRDDMTMWTFQPWCDGPSSVGLQAVKLAAPPPPTPDFVTRWCPWNPLGIPTVIQATNPAPKGFFDPGNDSGGPGFPNRFSVSISGGVQLLAPPMVFPDGFTLEIDPATATPGLHSVTVTNPDGQTTTGTNVLNILALVPDPILSNSSPVCQGGTAQLFLKPAPGTPPGAQSYLWLSGGVTLPTGVSDQQNPILTNVTLDQGGLYDGRIMVAGDTCGSAPTYTNLQVFADGAQNCCPGAPFSGCSQGRCMPDFDGDGRSDFCDSCPTVPGLDPTDSDGDGIGDLCDNCPANANPGTGPLNETFELSPAGFTPVNVGGPFGSTMTWAWTNSRCGGTYPSKGWRTLGSAGPNCDPFGFNQEDNLLVSPSITIPLGHSTIAFDAIGYDSGGACLNSGEQDAKEVVVIPYPQFPTSYTTISGCARLTQGTGVVTHNEFDLSFYSGMTVQIGFRYRANAFFSNSQGWMVDNVVIKGSQQADDADGDGHGGACDCAPSNVTTWGTVGEVLNLQMASGPGGGVSLTWSPPAGSYGAPGTVAYDVIRSTSANDFVGPGVCLETNDASDTAASDAAIPPVGQVYYYVVRPENPCGFGIAWRDSTGAARPARSCP